MSLKQRETFDKLFDELLGSEDYLKVQKLSVISKVLGTQILTGKHKSLHPGSSAEFKDHKTYNPGDNVNEINWKIYQKTKKLYVRRREQEVSVTHHFIIDDSASMNYGENSQNKWACSLMTAFVIGAAAIGQNDPVRILERRSRSPVTRSLGTFIDLIASHLQIKPDSKKSILEQALLRLTQSGRNIIWILSDLLMDPDEIVRFSRRYRNSGADIRIIQVLHPDEIEFPFMEPALFEGLEDEGNIEVFPEGLAKAYRKEVAEHKRSLEKKLLKEDIDFIQIRTDKSLLSQLSEFLKEQKYA